MILILILVIFSGENEIPVMPMLHILSTHGFLLSFDLLNFQPTRTDICSPPQNIADQSGLQKFQMTAIDSKPGDVTSPPANIGKPFSPNDLPANLTFSVAGNAVTSTPAKPAAQGLLQPKPVTEKPTVANAQPQPMPSGLFGSLSSFGSPSGGLTGLGNFYAVNSFLLNSFIQILISFFFYWLRFERNSQTDTNNTTNSGTTNYNFKCETNNRSG